MKDMATDVVELLDRLEWTDDKSVHLVGHSMGGMASQEIVSQPHSQTSPSSIPCPS